MTENQEKKAINRAVLVGLNAHCLSEAENADDSSMEELADLLETAGGQCVALGLGHAERDVIALQRGPVCRAGGAL